MGRVDTVARVRAIEVDQIPVEFSGGAPSHARDRDNGRMDSRPGIL